MNQQQVAQMQATMTALQAQVAAANAMATQAQADAQQAQAANVAQAAMVAQQQLDLVAAQAMAAQAVADVANAQAVAQAGGGAGPPGAAVNAPGQVLGVIIFDAAGIKLHKAASAPLRELFDGKAAKVMTFVNDLATRARGFGWDHLIFPITTASGAKNLLVNYSSITLPEIQAMADVYSATLPVATRASQASTQLHLLLQDSLTSELKDRVIARRLDYTFTVNGVTYEDGVAMLKVVFNLVAVDTQATVTVISRNLESTYLEAKLVQVEYDPIKYHLFVREQLLKLVQRNSPVPLIISGLFGAYKTVPDDAFASWATFTFQQWEMSSNSTWTNEYVMEEAEVRYNSIVEKGEWKVPTKHSEEIIALTARAEKAEAANQKRKLDPATASPSTRRKPNNSAKHGWKNVAPAGGEPHEKTVDKKEYVYCQYHGDLKWVLKEGHKDGCNNAPKTPNPAPAADPTIVTAVVTALAGIVADSE
jgi:multidrug efflux pump subunit AcrA (membrane-fusion protein)